MASPSIPNVLRNLTNTIRNIHSNGYALNNKGRGNKSVTSNSTKLMLSTRDTVHDLQTLVIGKLYLVARRRGNKHDSWILCRYNGTRNNEDGNAMYRFTPDDRRLPEIEFNDTMEFLGYNSYIVKEYLHGLNGVGIYSGGRRRGRRTIRRRRS